jgi:hypothetical protein
LWRSYPEILAVHLDVLTQTAAKLCAVVEADRGPTAEAMGEYIYPAQRGRGFLRQFSNYSERPSYQKLGELLDRYEAMVHRVDAARAAGAALDVGWLASERDTLVAVADTVRNEAQAGR